MSQPIDLGGNDIVCDSIRIGASSPGAAGTTLTGSEVTVLDGVTAGTVTASKALVVDSNKAIGSLGTLTMADSANIVLNVTTGTKVGTAATQKLAFYGAAPAVQPSVLAAVTTTAPIATFGWGFATSQQATLAIAAINQLIANQKTLGLMATS